MEKIIGLFILILVSMAQADNKIHTLYDITTLTNSSEQCVYEIETHNTISKLNCVNFLERSVLLNDAVKRASSAKIDFSVNELVFLQSKMSILLANVSKIREFSISQILNSICDKCE